LSSNTIEEIEGQKGVLRLLAYLYEVEEVNLQKILNETNLYARIVKNSVAILEKNGLVFTRVDRTSYPPRNMVSLTNKGKKVAEKIKEIEEIIDI
jgi:DNA-binding MarR family transcriptional regulator